MTKERKFDKIHGRRRQSRQKNYGLTYPKLKKTICNWKLNETRDDEARYAHILSERCYDIGCVLYGNVFIWIYILSVIKNMVAFCTLFDRFRTLDKKLCEDQVIYVDTFCGAWVANDILSAGHEIFLAAYDWMSGTKAVSKLQRSINALPLFCCTRLEGGGQRTLGFFIPHA